MSSTSETGHARNLAAFEQLISFCEGYGNRYNPSRTALQLSSLYLLLTDARDALHQVKMAEAAFGNATHARADLYKPLRPLATRVINALVVSEPSPGAVPAARSINKKIQGPGKKKETVPAAPTTEEGSTEAHKTISRSQASYDNLVDHLDKLNELLATEPNYQPFEPELSLTSLRQLSTNLHTANTSVINAYTAISNRRLQRNELFYNELSGMNSIALNVKNYVKSLFGASSPEYKQVRSLKMARPKAD